MTTLETIENFLDTYKMIDTIKRVDPDSEISNQILKVWYEQSEIPWNDIAKVRTKETHFNILMIKLGLYVINKANKT